MLEDRLMPYLKIQTNLELSDASRREILRKASVLLAKNLGKPEKYVMLRFDAAQPMMFAGSAEPCAFVELKSIGLPENRTAALSRVLCQFLGDELKIPSERIYIEFTDARDVMWGWDGGTF
jgi:phenylpyruvate tautomerase